MKIVLSANSLYYLSHFRFELIKALRSDAHDVVAIAAADTDPAPLLALGCRVLSIDVDKKGISPIKDLRLSSDLRRLYAAEAPDLILSFTIKSNVYGAMAARRCRLHFVPTITGFGSAFLSGPLLRLVACALYRRAFRTLPTVVFQNVDDLAEFRRMRLITAAQGRLIPGSGISMDRFAAAPLHPVAGGFTFLMIARLLRDKGVTEYVEAARTLQAERPDLRFLLVGPADVENRSAIGLRQVMEWQAEGAIDYLGERDDVRPDIARAQCVVLPSYREGLSRVLLEAAAMERPLLASDVPGCRDVIRDGISGYLCVPKDAVDLAAKMRLMADLPDQSLQAMGRAGRAHVGARFSDDIVISAHRRLVAEFGHRAGGTPGDPVSASAGYPETGNRT